MPKSVSVCWGASYLSLLWRVHNGTDKTEILKSDGEKQWLTLDILNYEDENLEQKEQKS